MRRNDEFSASGLFSGYESRLNNHIIDSLSNSFDSSELGFRNKSLGGTSSSNSVNGGLTATKRFERPLSSSRFNSSFEDFSSSNGPDGRWLKNNNLTVGQFPWISPRDREFQPKTILSPTRLKVRIGKPNQSTQGLSDSSFEDSFKEDSTKKVIQALKEISQKRSFRARPEEPEEEEPEDTGNVAKRPKIDHHHNLYLSQLETNQSLSDSNHRLSRTSDETCGKDVEDAEDSKMDESRGGKRVRAVDDVGGPRPKRRNNEILASLSSSIALLDPTYMYPIPIGRRARHKHERRKKKASKSIGTDFILKENQTEVEPVAKEDKCVGTDKIKESPRSINSDSQTEEPYREPSPVKEKEITGPAATKILLSAINKFTPAFPNMVTTSSKNEVSSVQTSIGNSSEKPTLTGFQFGPATTTKPIETMAITPTTPVATTASGFSLNVPTLGTGTPFSTNKPSIMTTTTSGGFVLGSKTNLGSGSTLLGFPPNTQPISSTTATTTTAGFTFDSNQETSKTETPKTTAPAFSLGSSTSTAGGGTFSFTSTSSSTDQPKTSTQSAPVFSFSSPTTIANTTSGPSTTSTPSMFSTTNTTTTTAPFSFGAPPSSTTVVQQVKQPTFSFGSSSTAKTETTVSTSTTPTATIQQTKATSDPPKSLFGSAPSSEPQKNMFATTTTAQEQPKLSNSFGASGPFSIVSNTNKDAANPTGAFNVPKTEPSKPGGGLFSFGKTDSKPNPPAFAFGANSVKPEEKPQTTTSAFQFGKSNPAFGATSTTKAADTPSSGFGSGNMFGAPAATTTSSLLGAFNTTPPTTSTAPVKFGSGSFGQQSSGFNFNTPKPAEKPAGFTFKFGQNAPTETPKSSFNFSATTTAPAFGSTTTATTTSGSGIFGGSTGMFGNPQPPSFSATSGFGSAPTFGSSATSATPAFGATVTTSVPAFGSSAPTATSAFGSTATNPTPSFGSTATNSAPAFGSSAPGFGASSANPTTAFGASATNSTPSFGSTQPNTTPAFGASAAPAFGATSTPSFGSFGNQPSATPAFGNPQPSSAFTFGAQSSTPSAPPSFNFTAQTPAQPSSSGGMFQFGASQQAPSTGAVQPFNFNASTPQVGGQMFNIGSGSTAPRTRHQGRPRKK